MQHVLQLGSGQCQDPLTEAQRAWLRVKPAAALAAWRAELLAAGLTPAGWRWLTHVPPAQLMALTARRLVEDLTGHELARRSEWTKHIPIINLIAARQIPAAGQHVSTWLPLLDHVATVPTQVWPALVEALVRHVVEHAPSARRPRLPGGKLASNSPRDQFVQTLHTRELPLLLDYFNPSALADVAWEPLEDYAAAGVEWPEQPAWWDDGARLTVPKGAGFGWFVRRQQEWHRRAQALRNDAHRANEMLAAIQHNDPEEAARIKQAVQWDCALAQTQIDGVDVVPLTTAQQLSLDGYEMHHCVGSYARKCWGGASRIFSLQKGDARLATLELCYYRPDSSWYIAQLMGACNSKVDDQLHAVAKQVCSLHAQAVAAAGGHKLNCAEDYCD